MRPWLLAALAACSAPAAVRPPVPVPAPTVPDRLPDPLETANLDFESGATGWVSDSSYAVDVVADDAVIYVATVTPSHLLPGAVDA